MVELVLNDPRRRAFEVVSDLLPALVEPFDPHGGRAHDGHRDALNGEATFVVRVDLVASPDDLRIDERCDLILLRGEDEDAAENADLGRREADAVGLLHQLAHPRHEPAQVVVELLDGARLHAEDGVGVLPDLRQRKLPSRLVLGVELLGSYLSFHLRHGRHTSGVERREREAIMRQGVSRAETPRDRAQRDALEEDLLGNPLAGAPLRQRLRNFRPDATAQLAALGGPLAWMRRLRAIELAIDFHELQLAEVYAALREEYGTDAERFARAWGEIAGQWDFGEVNDLIERHNRHYPAESRLPMNPRTGDFVLVNGRPYTREALDGAWILARFPAEGQT
jgi:hypothetical protein